MRNILLGIIAINLTFFLSGCAKKEPVKQLKIRDIDRACQVMNTGYNTAYNVGEREFERTWHEELFKLEDLAGYECGAFGNNIEHSDVMKGLFLKKFKMMTNSIMIDDFPKSCREKLTEIFEASLEGNFEDYPKCD